MSWVKKIWNRMFTDEVEEEVTPEYEAPIEQPGRNVPFRFPLITDEEREIFLKREASGEKVTMAEVRQELVRRPRQPSPSEQREKLAESRAVRRPVQQAPRRQPPAARPVQQSTPEPVRRRYEPTRIPSPIHGYNERKPERIEKLLETKELKVEFQKAILPQPEIPATELVKEESATPEEIAVPAKKQEIAPEPLKEKEKIVVQPVEEITVHSETIPAAAESQPPATVNAEKKKEKTVPFNVLMLKSDKEKIKKLNPLSVKLQPVPVQKQETPIKPAGAETAAINKSAEPMPQAAPEAKSDPGYEHPHSSFLQVPENDRKDDEWMEEQGERLIEALSHFQVQATILSIIQGPAVTQFELTVAQGVKVSKIRNLADDLKLALAAKDIRIQAPIPGKSSIGIEIPNRTSRAVRISEVINSTQFRDSDSPVEAALGLDLTGKPVTLDLRKMPHGLVAGATGSGKSVFINSLLVSLLYKSSPRDLKLLLIDPKMVELAPYNHIPHLVSPVITDVKAATASLKWAVSEMERRYQLFAHAGVRDISRYNKLVKEKGDHAQHLPYILIVIDELADLMMMSPSDVEDAICRIAQKARACGIHLVIATQRPSVDVITGLIKSNIPTRIAFSVSSQVDSRTILDSQGAERLLGRGDMLYLGNGMSAPSRIQGTFVTDEEIEQIIEHVRSQGEPEYFFKEEELIKQGGSGAEQDELFEEACRFIMQQGSASTSLLQRKFHIGYNRAARLMDLIEEHGFISEQNGSKPRSVLITEDDMSEVFQ
ncbi:DNA translocase FtsK [Planococcus sp. CAU13]|uniref:DNA translocase FtsK n=1 Tax=Planococcus sp. CAU13 TaxID=1541197 RepID=UPI00052FDCFA|nr:DNA translocase FtsK [Planococcus sp. CAU13]